MDNRLRFLWIGQRPTSEHGGDVIYDRRLRDACRALGAQIDCVELSPVSRRAELVNLSRGQAYYRARYDSPENHARIAQAAREHDRAVCSWEPLDRLAAFCPVPTLPILHNVTSQSLPAMYPRNPLFKLAAMQAGLWERRAYGGGRFPAIVTLSEADRARVRRIAGAPNVVLAPPGMPPLVPLPTRPESVRELLLWGSFDWAPKRRDVLSFAHAYAQTAGPMQLIGGQLPDEVRRLLPCNPDEDGVRRTPAVRFGLIPDRFAAGFKLKSTAYLANNAVVLSFADIASEFASIEDHAFFIRRIDHAADIARHVDEVQSVDRTVLGERFERFKQRCAERFSWDVSARALLAAVRAAV